jgi:SAM-dependent methyltransferase
MPAAPRSAPEPAVPNHHADYPGFSGIGGAIAGLTMLIGRGSVARLATELTDAGPDDHVVDVGCGPGGAARAAARRGARVSAVDPAPVMLRLARMTSRESLGISWLDGAAEALPLPDGSATILWSIATVHHWPDLDGGLAEAFRVLRPGGRLLAIERRTRPGARGLASHGWTDRQAESFAEHCLDAGFTDIRTEKRRLRRQYQLAVLATRPGTPGAGAG